MEFRKSVDIIIPIFRNSATISLLNARIAEVTNKFTNYDFRLVFIDDGSDDNSTEKIKSFSYSLPVTLYVLAKNYGQVAAITCGLNHCKADACIILSADLQDPPELFEEMLTRWQKDNSLVIATRESRQDALINRITSRLFYLSLKIAGANIPVLGFDYVLLDKTCIDLLNTNKAETRFLQAEMVNAPLKKEFIAYTKEKRKAGKSQWRLKQKMRYWATGFQLHSSPYFLYVTLLISLLFIGIGFAKTNWLFFLIGGVSALLFSILFYLKTIYKLQPNAIYQIKEKLTVN
jgi:glycosyltransferase involved in cell wall biosynthesis